MSPRFLSLLLFVSLACALRAGTLQNPGRGNQASSYIELLKSPNETKRQEGKQRLLSLGAESIDPLLALLEEISRDEFRPWFALGREKEGKEAWEHYQALDPRKVNERRVALAGC